MISIDENKVVLKDEKGEIYISKYVKTKQQFYDIMKTVAETFEKMGEMLESGGRFGATCFTPPEWDAQLTVNMMAKN